jgi:hypothetical protein
MAYTKTRQKLGSKAHNYNMTGYPQLRLPTPAKQLPWGSAVGGEKDNQISVARGAGPGWVTVHEL